MRMSDSSQDRHTGELSEIYEVLDLYSIHNKTYLEVKNEF